MGRKDWLQFLQEQAKQDAQQRFHAKSSAETKSCQGSAKDACGLQKLQVEEKTRGDLDDSELKQQQHEGNSVDAAISHHSVKLQYRSQEDELDEDCGQSSNHSQERVKAQLSLEEAPPTPFSALLNTSLSSPTLLLPHCEYYLQIYLFLFDNCLKY